MYMPEIILDVVDDCDLFVDIHKLYKVEVYD